mgnify:FL=1|tara:strand:+ start:124 stop:963 length:840 start_codon:yes stop_codon:yes gene_type:complete
MDNTTDTVAQPDYAEPVTDTANPVDNVQAESSDTKSDIKLTPSVEIRDGKTYVDGVRVYTRDDTNKIAANAKNEVESRLVRDLNVDSIDSVRQVVRTLQETSKEEGGQLNVESLRAAVKKREATVDELQKQVQSLKTDLLLKDHMGNLQAAMPGNWTADQKTAVVDLMKVRNMLAIDGDTFAIKHGNEYLTTDGETPDYASAVNTVGQSLGFQFGKKGIDLQLGETHGTPPGSKNAEVDMARVNANAEYRAAYMRIRKYQTHIDKSAITDTMVKSEMSR